MKALTLAEMQAFLQKRTDEDETAKQDIKTLMDEISGYDYDSIKVFQYKEKVKWEYKLKTNW